jgi:hypothetical protein
MTVTLVKRVRAIESSLDVAAQSGVGWIAPLARDGEPLALRITRISVFGRARDSAGNPCGSQRSAIVACRGHGRYLRPPLLLA